MTRPFRANGLLLLIERVGWFQLRSDGEGVKVVGEDRPSGPGLHPVVVLQAAAAQSVAAFEVADPPFAAGPVAGEASLGSSASRAVVGRR